MIDINKLMPTNDVIFKAILGDPRHTSGLIHFLNSALRPENPIVSVQIENAELIKEHVLEKGARLDILATTNTNEIVNIECQAGSDVAIIARMLYYWGRKFTQQLNVGGQYGTLKRTVGIAVLNFNSQIDDIRYQVRGRIFDCDTLTQMTDLLELHFLDLTKLHGVDENNPITWWMEFFKNPYSEEAKLIYERIPEIKEAKQMFEKVKVDPKYIELIRMREEANMEFNNALANVRTEEREKAEREKQELTEKMEREKQELTEKAEREKQELTEKAEREKQELVKKLLHMGLSVEQVSVATRLTIEEVKSIQKKIQ